MTDGIAPAPEAPAPEAPEDKVDPQLSEEIGAAVGKVADEHGEVDAGGEGDEDEDGGDPGQIEHEAPAESAPALTDSVIERAVKCGIPLTEAKQYPTEDLLSAACARVEGPQGGGSGSQNGADSAGSESPLSAIPDLDPDIYDEGLVAVFKSMKGVMEQQQKTIEGLRAGKSQDWFSRQLETVEGALKGDPEKTEALKGKFKVLTAGYEAAGETVDRVLVFNEASQLVLGADIKAAKQKAKGQKARQRNGQFVNRPTGRNAKAKGPDAASEIAAMIDAKFRG